MMERALRHIDPEQLASVSDLSLLARTVVDGLMAGIHRSPHSGSSIEFAQYRPYTQGDDLRNIDWHLYGRTDRLHIKQYEEETTLRATLLLDCSGSMDYSSHGVTKFSYSRMLAASLAVLLQRQRDAVGLITYHDALLTYIPPGSSAKHVRRILVELDNAAAQGETDTPKALHYLGDVLSPRGMVILISDLLHPVKDMLKQLKSLRARHQDVLVLHIADPAEKIFPFEKSITLLDVETGREQFTVPESVREQYLENRSRHFKEIYDACHASEIDICEFSTVEPLDRALNIYLHHRRRASAQTNTSRRRAPGGT